MKIDWSQIRAPIPISYEDWKNKEKRKDYLFTTKIDDTLSLLEELTKENKEVSRNLSITGERGAGKTSILISLKNILEGEGYYVFDILDPSILNENLNILEVLISNIYEMMDDSKDYNNEMDYIDKAKIHKKLKEIIDTLVDLRQKNSYFKKNNPSIEVLESIKNRKQLDENINSLLEESKKYLGLNGEYIKDFVLIIDDMDLLDNDLTAKLIDDIQKYLDTKIILIFAYRESQLENALFEAKKQDNKALLENNIISSIEIKNQVSNLLEKLIPYPNRIELHTKEELLNENMDKVLQTIGFNKKNEESIEVSIKDWFYDSIFKKTNLSIRPVDARDGKIDILPDSLRGVMQFIEIIESKMEDKEEKTDVGEVSLDYFQKNLSIFKEYFMTRSSNFLSKEDKDFIKKWSFADSHNKNYLTYHYFYNKLIDDENRDKKYPLNLSKYEPYNLALGDIYAILEYYKDNTIGTDSEYFIVYFIKLLYSICLKEHLGNIENDYINDNEIFDNGDFILYLTDIEKENGGEQNDIISEKFKNLTSYLELINTRVLPRDFSYYNSRGGKKDWENYTIDFILEEYDNNNLYRRMVDKTIGSDLATKGDVRSGIYNSVIPFRFRYLYNYKILNLRDGRSYYYDFYNFLGKCKYVVNSIVYNLDKNNLDRYYIFSSLFEIDIFIRATYDNRSSKDKYAYVLRVINRLLSGEMIKTSQNQYIKDKLKDFGIYVFSTENIYKKIFYKEVYSKDEIELIEKINEDRLLNREKYKNLERNVNNTLNSIKKDKLKNITEEILINVKLLKEEEDELEDTLSHFNGKRTTGRIKDRKRLENIILKYPEALEIFNDIIKDEN